MLRRSTWSRLKWYTVKKGETLLAVARKLGVAQSDLAEANDLKSTARLAAGQKLMVPREATVLMAARTERTVPVADSRPISTQAPRWRKTPPIRTV